MLDQLFHQLKQLLISKLEEGINTFDTKQQTYLQTDWNKNGIRYLLFQKYCNCSDENTPVCCSGDQKLVFAESKFTTPTESRYLPTKGKTLAATWPLENARMFVQGCPELIVVTNHKTTQ